LVSTAVLVVPDVDEKTAVRFRGLPGAKFVPVTVAVMQCGPVTGFVALTDESDDGGPRVSVGASTVNGRSAVSVGLAVARMAAAPAGTVNGSVAVTVKRPAASGVPPLLVSVVETPAESVMLSVTGPIPVVAGVILPVTVIGTPTGPAVGLIDAVLVAVPVKVTGVDGPIV